MPSEATDWMNLTQAAGLKPLTIKDRTLLPIVQGGMGVGVSASGLASAVARMGGMGTISSVDLRRRHADLMAQTAHLDKEPDARERINAARKRFHANDNIAEYIQPGELETLLDEVEVQMRGVLNSLVIDIENDHNTDNTARRVAKMYLNEVFRGRYVPAPTITEFPNVGHLNELMIVGPITVRSACSHHFCPVIGKIWIGVLPNERTNVIGLSKYARLAEWVMGRPQIQEEAVVQLADLIQEKTQPDGLAIVMEASHFCMSWRGVKDMDSKMINSVMRGAFLKDPNLRREFLSLIPK